MFTAYCSFGSWSELKTTRVPKSVGSVTPSALSSFWIASAGIMSGVISGSVSWCPTSWLIVADADCRAWFTSGR